LNNKISLTKSNAIFLATVLVLGTFAAISPSSFIIGVNAQTEPYYEMENGYSSYEAEPLEYPPQYTEREYNNDNYESKYTSYGKDNSYKSKDRASIKKINCVNINTNININGNSNGDINNFARSPGNGIATAAEDETEGDFSTSSFENGERYNGYDDGYKKDKDFDCIIGNNNNNGETGDSDGVGDGVGDGVEACVDCFEEYLDPTQLADVNTALEGGVEITIEGTGVIINSLQDLCNELEGATIQQAIAAVNDVLGAAEVQLEGTTGVLLMQCIAAALGINI
jgi:hypothetical protein